MARALLLLPPVALCLAAAHAVIFEGGPPFSEEVLCVPAAGRPSGVCRRSSNCPAAPKNSPSCGLPGADYSDLKCCPHPISPGPQIGDLSRRACQGYTKAKPSCDNFQPPAAGPEVRPGDFPYFASLGYKSKSGDGKTNWYCGGALISENFVLTAATCALGKGGPVQVRLGGVTFREGARVDAGVQELDVAEMMVHPAHNASSRHNDIALLRLAGRVKLTRNVQPACLYPEKLLPVGRAVIAGAGARTTNFSDIGTLTKVDVPIVPLEKCKELYKRLIKEPLPSSVLCAGEKERDSCTGDSGAPLVIKEGAPTCNYQIAGITSFGPRVCGSLPGVYTNVYAFLPWIEEKVWK